MTALSLSLSAAISVALTVATLLAATAATAAPSGAAVAHWRLDEPLRPLRYAAAVPRPGGLVAPRPLPASPPSSPPSPPPPTPCEAAAATAAYGPSSGGVLVGGRCARCPLSPAAANATPPLACFLPHCGCWARDCAHGGLGRQSLRCECSAPWARAPATGACTLPPAAAPESAAAALPSAPAPAPAERAAQAASRLPPAPPLPSHEQRVIDAALGLVCCLNVAAWGVALRYAKQMRAR